MCIRNHYLQIIGLIMGASTFMEIIFQIPVIRLSFSSSSSHPYVLDQLFFLWIFFDFLFSFDESMNALVTVIVWILRTYKGIEHPNFGSLKNYIKTVMIELSHI